MDLRQAIKEAGGLCSQVGLAKRWGVSKARVNEAVRHPDFPAPVETDCGDGRLLWFGNEADAWRAVARLPGPRPAQPDDSS